MARKKGKRPQPVQVKTAGKNPYHVGTITVEDQLGMERAARRQRQIESGLNPGSGSGAHGGNKRQQRRKDRRDGKRVTRDLA